MLPVFAACTTPAPSDGTGTLGFPGATTTGDVPESTSTGAGSETGAAGTSTGSNPTEGTADDGTDEGPIFDLGVPDMPPSWRSAFAARSR